jgi:hypothetical protein
MSPGAALRRPPGRALVWVLLAAGLVACGGDKKNNPAGASNESLDFVFEHNASRNDGRTVRWANLPIRVFLANVAREEEVTEWTQASGGLVTFTFVGSRSGADIAISFAALPDDICGETRITFRRGSGELVAIVEVSINRAIFRQRNCVGGRTVTHEIGHAIGFFGHTDDGGLMDEQGVSGEITGPVADMIRTLYSLAPGTTIRPQAQSTTARPSGGIGSIVIIDRIAR